MTARRTHTKAPAAARVKKQADGRAQEPVSASISGHRQRANFLFQGIGSRKITADALSQLHNVVRALAILQMDKATCDVTLKLRDGNFSGLIGISNQVVRIGHFGLAGNANPVVEAAVDGMFGLREEANGEDDKP